MLEEHDLLDEWIFARFVRANCMNRIVRVLELKKCNNSSKLLENGIELLKVIHDRISFFERLFTSPRTIFEKYYRKEAICFIIQNCNYNSEFQLIDTNLHLKR